MDVCSESQKAGKPSESSLSRSSLCLAGEGSGGSIHHGDAGFDALLSRHFRNCESEAAERLVSLKTALKTSNPKLSWDKLLEELAALSHAPCAFISYTLDWANNKRPSQDMTIKCYYNDGSGNESLLRDRNCSTIAAICQQMNHGKVFLVPEGLHTCAISNDLPFAAEAMMIAPLWSGNHNIGHIGMIWTDQGLQQQSLSWSYIEMLLHSLEDLVIQRIVEENNLLIQMSESRVPSLSESPSQRASTVSQTASAPLSPIFTHPLKPYAPSLSHELRTPMQGVVGMLDVMHANVKEAIDARISNKSLRLLQDLKENIELVQYSARRAIEAADNVVHAYDLNMEIPETPQKEIYPDIMADLPPPVAAAAAPGERFSFKENKLPPNPYKRRRSISIDWTGHGRPPKRSSRKVASHSDLSPRSEVKSAVHESDKIVYSPSSGRLEEVLVNAVTQKPSLATRRMAPQMVIEGVPPTAIRQTKIRDLLHLVINESLHVDKRPESTLSQRTLLGERIDVHALASNGHTCVKTIEWSVEPTVPDNLYVDERDLAKLISCVFLNAVKFTESGEIEVWATTSSDEAPQYIRINIRDTGMGIPEEFFPNLFKPFAREDDSTTRTRDGLGLGLLVAKGLARKMGGDLLCVHSATSGPDRGSEFEIRIPLNPCGALSRPRTSHNKNGTLLSAGPSSSQINASVQTAIDVQPKTIKTILPLETVVPADGPILSPVTTSQPQPLTNSCCRQQTTCQPPSALQGTKIGKTYPLTFLVAEDNQINRKILVNMLRKLGYCDVYEAYDGKEAVRIMQETLLSSYPLPSPLSSPSIQGSDSGVGNSLSPVDMENPGNRKKAKPIDVVLMDLWMPEMDGYEATSKIFEMVDEHYHRLAPRNLVKHNSSVENWDPRSEPDFPSLSNISPKILAVTADATDEALNRASQVGIEGYMTKPYKLADLERLIIDCCFPQMSE